MSQLLTKITDLPDSYDHTVFENQTRLLWFVWLRTKALSDEGMKEAFYLPCTHTNKQRITAHQKGTFYKAAELTAS